MSDEAPPPTSPDAYAAQYMGAGGAVLHERRRMPWWFFALMGVAMAAQVGGAVASASPLPLLLSLPILLVVTLLLSHLRVVLSPTHLHVQYGLWGPKVRLEDIVSVKAEPYSAARFGGWGIKRALDGTWAWSTPGGNGMALSVEARDGSGGTRRLCITLDAAEAFRARIEELRAGATGVRVDAATAEGEALEREAGARADEAAKR